MAVGEMSWGSRGFEPLREVRARADPIVEIAISEVGEPPRVLSFGFDRVVTIGRAGLGNDVEIDGSSETISRCATDTLAGSGGITASDIRKRSGSGPMVWRRSTATARPKFELSE